MFRYRLHSPEGDDLGEATYTMMIHAGEDIHGSDGDRLRMLDVVVFGETTHPCWWGCSRSRRRDQRGRAEVAGQECRWARPSGRLGPPERMPRAVSRSG
jgi:hypothetical protein